MSLIYPCRSGRAIRCIVVVAYMSTAFVHPQYAAAEPLESSHGSLSSKKAASASEDSSVDCTAPHLVPELHSPKPEAPAVLETVKAMAKASARGSQEQYRACLDDDCTVFDESNKKMLVGKDAAVAAMMKEFNADGSPEKHRTVSIRIDQPYVKVAGNSAIVSYHLEKLSTFDGEKPRKRSAFVTQVFIKDGDAWKLSSHTRGQWTEETEKQPSGS